MPIKQQMFKKSNVHKQKERQSNRNKKFTVMRYVCPPPIKCHRCNCLTTRLVETTLANVSNPLDDVMVTVIQFRFEYLQVTDFETRRSKRHLKQKSRVNMDTSKLSVNQRQNYHTTTGKSVIFPKRMMDDKRYVQEAEENNDIICHLSIILHVQR